MRYIFGILCVILFAGFVACTVLLGGPHKDIYALRNICLGGALACAVLSAAMLGILASGIGAKGKKTSSWGVPVFCALFALVNFGLGGLLLARLLTYQGPNTQEDVAMGTRLYICVSAMFVLGMFSLGSLIVALLLAKRRNSKLALTQ